MPPDVNKGTTVKLGASAFIQSLFLDVAKIVM